MSRVVSKKARKYLVVAALVVFFLITATRIHFSKNIQRNTDSIDTNSLGSSENIPFLVSEYIENEIATQSETTETGTISFYVDIDEAWQLVEKRDVPIYWLTKDTSGVGSNSYYVKIKDIEDIFAKYGFKASDISSATTYILPHAGGDNTKIWADRDCVNVPENGEDVWYMPVLQKSWKNGWCNVYYAPEGTKGDYWPSGYTYLRDNAFYTRSVEDIFHEVYKEDELPETKIAKRDSEDVVEITVKQTTGKGRWICKATNSNATVPGVDNGDGTITFTITDNTRPYQVKLLSAIKTVDTSDNIKLNLFDYTVGDASNTYREDLDSFNTGINNGHALSFAKGYTKYDGNYPSINANGNPLLGIVQKKLGSDGFPVLKDDASGESLAYLFNETPIENIKSVHSNLTHLFQYDEDTGVYSYSSEKNYAYLDLTKDKDNKNFVVYNYPATTQAHGTAFMPFSKYENINGVSAMPSYNAPLDSTNKNHYFGMTMSTSFMQPKDGVIKDQDMVFEFTGDDDVWLYIDGVLTLDIGGIHDFITGKVNFKTGEITVGGDSGYTTTIKAVMQDALGMSDDEFSGDTFKDYSTHEFKFFYLERGNWGSNCRMSFNLGTVAENSVVVTKDVKNKTENADVDYKNIEFEFQILYEGSVYANQEYKIYKDGIDTGKTGVTDKLGKFILKDRESAIFEGLNSYQTYQVKELGAYLSGYSIKIDDTKITNEDNEDLSINEVSTEDLSVKTHPSVVFENSFTKLADLNITKQVIGKENVDVDEYFTMYVELNEAPYSGAYTVVDSNGSATNKQTTDGNIQIKSGEKATIPNLLYGTKFKVKETLDSDNEWLTTYNASEKAIDLNVEDYVSGKIAGTTDVTVTNTNILESVAVSKTFLGDDEQEIENIKKNYYISVVDGDGNEVYRLILDTVNNSKDLKINVPQYHENNTYTWIIDLDNTKTYKAYEKNYTGGENTITSAKYKKSNTESTYTDYTDDGVEIQKNDNAANVLLFRNSYNKIRKDFSFAKLDENGNPLPDATFSLYTLYSNNECTNIVASSKSQEDGNVNFSQISAGTYYMKETTAPDGYKANEDKVYTIVITANGYTITDEDGNPVTSIKNELYKTTVTLKKTDMFGSVLSGAKFELYKKNADTDEYEKIKNGDNEYFVVSGLGEASFGSLLNGEYKILEVKAPDGYNKLSREILFSIRKGTVTLDNNVSGISVSGQDNVFTITVKNSKIIDLPETGGPGVYVFVVSGLAIMIIAIYNLKKSKAK